MDRFGQGVLTVEYDSWKPTKITLTDGTRTINLHWATLGAFAVLEYIQFPVTSDTGTDLTLKFNRTLSSFTRMGEERVCTEFPLRDPVTLPKLNDIHADGISDLTYAFGYATDATDSRLLSLTLPTGGRIEYTYGNDGTLFPCLRKTDRCDPYTDDANRSPDPNGVIVPSSGRYAAFLKYVDTLPRVSKRKEVDPVTTYTSETNYSRGQFAEWDLNPDLDQVCHPNNPSENVNHCPDPNRSLRRVVVTSPGGTDTAGNPLYHYTSHIFRVNVNGSDSGADVTGGLEHTRRYYDGTTITSNNPIRSLTFCHEDFRTRSDPQAPFDGVCGDRGSDGKFWDLDVYLTLGPPQPGSGDEAYFNYIRRQKEMTWYGANPAGATDCSISTTIPCKQLAYASTAYDRDALEYKESKLSSNFGNGGWQKRTTNTTWSPDVTRWLLKRPASQIVTDDFEAGVCGTTGLPVPCSVTTTSQYDASKPAFLSSRTVSMTTSSNGTLTHIFTADTKGNPHQDNARTTGTDYDGSEYTDTREFRYGAVTTRTRSDFSWQPFNVTRTGAANLITKATAPYGLETKYFYDSLGRVTKITPPEIAPPGGGPPIPTEGNLTIAYVPYVASPVSAGYVIVKKKPVGTDSAPDDNIPGSGSGSVEAFQYDGFGRLIRAIKRLPAQVDSSFFTVQEMRYDSAGGLTRRSEWTGCSTGPTGSGTDLRGCLTTSTAGSPATTWTNRDPFGRPRNTSLPDGKQTIRSFSDTLLGTALSYSDTKEAVIRGVWNGTAEVAQTTTSQRDILGRIIAVAEPLLGSESEASRTTTYTYNVLDQLATVTQKDTEASPPPGTTQTRTFKYNGPGQLTYESQPETGTTTYTYTVHGKPKTKNAAGTSYTYGYDSLGRLTSLASGGTTYISNTYDTGGGTYGLGRLTQQVGYNPVQSPAVSVTENYTYSDVSGRLSSKQTTISGGGSLGSVTET